MNAAEVLRFALRGLAANKMRSALTMLGILIGVAAVILLVAIGEGSSQQIQQNIQRLGANSLTVTPSTSGGGGGPGGGFARGFGGGFGGGGGGGQAGRQNSGPRTQAKDLTVDDARALADPASAPSVKSVSPVVTAQSQTATYEGASHSISQLVGTYPSYFEASNKPVVKGAYFYNDDVLAARKVVVIGQTVAENLFGTVDPLGKQITVSGVPFTVVGVLKEAGSSGFQDADDVAIAPLPAVQQSLTGFGPLGQILVQAKSAEAVDAAQTEVTEVLNQRHASPTRRAPTIASSTRRPCRRRSARRPGRSRSCSARWPRSACSSAASASPTSCSSRSPSGPGRSASARRSARPRVRSSASSSPRRRCSASSAACWAC